MNHLRKKADQCSTKTIWLPASQKGHYCGTDMHMPTGGVPVHHYLLLVLPLIELPWIWLTTNSQVRCWQHYIWESARTSGKSNISQYCPWRITSCVQNANISMIAFKKSQTINNPTKKKKVEKRNQTGAVAEVCTAGSPRMKQINETAEISPPRLLWAAASLGHLWGLQSVCLHSSAWRIWLSSGSCPRFANRDIHY